MASISIAIENDMAASQFDGAVERACMVAGDMIVVQTSIRNGRITKTVKTKCSLALSIIETANPEGGLND